MSETYETKHLVPNISHVTVTLIFVPLISLAGLFSCKYLIILCPLLNYTNCSTQADIKPLYTMYAFSLMVLLKRKLYLESSVLANYPTLLLPISLFISDTKVKLPQVVHQNKNPKLFIHKQLNAAFIMCSTKCTLCRGDTGHVSCQDLNKSYTN